MNAIIKFFKDLRLYVAIVGLILSVLLHELFHIVMHWDSIVSIALFPDIHTIMEVNSVSLHSYDTTAEELIAYTITVIVLLATAMAIATIHDSKDTRSFADILLPKHSDMHDLTDTELIELAYRTSLFKPRV